MPEKVKSITELPGVMAPGPAFTGNANQSTLLAALETAGNISGVEDELQDLQIHNERTAPEVRLYVHAD